MPFLLNFSERKSPQKHLLCHLRSKTGNFCVMNADKGPHLRGLPPMGFASQTMLSAS